MADIATTMRESLLAMAVSAGLAVMGSLMEESVTALCGPKVNMTLASAVARGRRRLSDPGSRRVRVRRPVRATRSANCRPRYDLFSSTEPLARWPWPRCWQTVTRRYTGPG